MLTPQQYWANWRQPKSAIIIGGVVAALNVGDLLRGGRYEVQRLLHSARDKKIYLAQDRELGCLVTVDVFSNNAVMPTGLTVSAWETRVLGQLGDHRNIATVLDHWEDGNTAFMVTRYLSGGSLEDLIARSQESGEKLPAARILEVAIEVASALDHIHRRRILYRDLQPRNVLFDEWGTVHLVDFDTAVSADQREASSLAHRPANGYAAPELAGGGTADERADLYSLGATIYAMCQGHPPQSAELRGAGRLANRPPAVDRDDLPEGVCHLVARLLASARDQRPATAAEVVEELDGLRTAPARDQAATPAREDSQALPEPNAAELSAQVRARAADYAVGDVLDGRFDVLAVLGRGGFSKVYRVRDNLEGEERALKLFDSAAGYAAVRREVIALRKIHHPNVVEVFWADTTRAGEWYLITEFIEGDPLDEFVSGRRHLRDREAVDVALDLLDALAAFHPDTERISELDARGRDGDLSEDEYQQWVELKEKGLVHRDIKPHNVILTRTRAKLLDFNIASRVGDPVRTLSGTPPYQPPEADLTRWDVSTDLFAVGVVLYQLLCNGRHPYPNATPMVDEPVIDPTTMRPDLAPGLAEFLIKACTPGKADRFPTAAAMGLALRKVRDDL
jgi:serine/threonine protein kinase